MDLAAGSWGESLCVRRNESTGIGDSTKRLTNRRAWPCDDIDRS